MNATPHFSGLQQRPCLLGSSRSSDRQASGRLLFALAEKSALSVASKASLRCRRVPPLEQGGVTRDRWSSSTPATSSAPAAAARVTYDAKVGTVEGNRIADCHDACKGGGETSASARCWCMSSAALVSSSTSAGLGNSSAPRSSVSRRIRARFRVSTRGVCWTVIALLVVEAWRGSVGWAPAASLLVSGAAGRMLTVYRAVMSGLGVLPTMCVSA